MKTEVKRVSQVIVKGNGVILRKLESIDKLLVELKT